MLADEREGMEGVNVPGNGNNEKQIRVFPFSCLVPPTLLYPSVTHHSVSLEQLSLQWRLGIGKCQFDDSFHSALNVSVVSMLGQHNSYCLFLGRFAFI